MTTPAAEGVLAAAVLGRFASPHPVPAVVGAVHLLARSLVEDHVALDLGDATTIDALSVLSEGAVTFDGVLAALARETRLVQFAEPTEVIDPVGPPVVVVDGRLYLRRLAAAEQRLAATFVAARATPVDLPGGLDATTFERAVSSVSEQLADAGTPSVELASVARLALTRRASLLTGGPGTGKTWLVTRVLSVLDAALAAAPPARPVSFVVAAPTGRAAQRLAEVLDGAGGLVHLVRDREREGSLHRLLGRHPHGDETVAALHHDLVIVDEVSMADLPMLDLLMRATPGSRVLLVGDPHQLVSVNVGAVLADVVASEARLDAVVSRLTVVRRTDRRAILDLAAAINDGDAPSVTALLVRGSEEIDLRATVDDYLVELVARHAREVGDLAVVGDGPGALARVRALGVLCANRAGPGSVAWFNARIGSEHRARVGVAAGERHCVGEPVMVTRNQRALGVSNGDVGVVVEHDGRRQVYFDEHRVFPAGGVGYLESAWAMTIHKSQGSEVEHAVVVLPRGDSPLLTRELFYTGVTRATRRVTVVGGSSEVERAVRTPITRVSGLTARLASWAETA